MANEPVDDIGVCLTIAPEDDMYTGDDAAYLEVGRGAIDCIHRSLDAAGMPVANVTRILDLPCGYGRVQRHLRVAFPFAEIFSCDLMRGGVDFCSTTFGCTPVYSDEDPRKLPLPDGSFDLIWVGSLLTHLRATRWGDFLHLFRRILRPGGVLVFSTHGRKVYECTARRINTDLPAWRATAVCRAYELRGFGYASYLGNSTYGHSLSRADWVLREIDRAGELRVVHFAESGWVRYQDVFACVRDSSWVNRPPSSSALTNLGHRVTELLWRIVRGASG